MARFGSGLFSAVFDMNGTLECHNGISMGDESLRSSPRSF
jgi:hypothetical protein